MPDDVSNPSPSVDADDVLERRLRRRQRTVQVLDGWFAPGSVSPDEQLLAGALVVAAVARFALVPGQNLPFLWPTLLMLFGAVLLYARRLSVLAWCAILSGALWSLLANSDWLTQTALIASFSAAGLAGAALGEPGRRAARGAIVGIGAAGYLLAALHKLNRDFIDPELSCANEGLRRLTPFFGDWVATDRAFAAAPHAVLVVEVLLGVSLLVAPRAGIVLAALFHIGLTLTFEPVFPFVMGIAFVAAGALTPIDRRNRRRAAGILLPCLIVSLPVLLADAPLVRWDLPLRLAAMLWAAAWAIAGPRGDTPRTRMSGRGVVAGFALFFIAGLTPYAGTRVQHSAAMLSNLRVDEGCWNHLVIPESVRAVDAYVRIDTARVGAGNERLQQILTETLWSTNALRSLRSNWCTPSLRPIEIDGTFQGVRLYYTDLCDEAVPLPVGPGSFGGREWFPRYLRFQKNLPRVCSPACMH